MTVSVQATEDKFFSITRRMSRWVEQALEPGYHRYCPAETWAPAINVFEYVTHYCVVVDLAGVSADQIDLRVEGNRREALVVSGRRAAPGLPDAGKPLRLHAMEIDHGRFSRSLDLPENVDVDLIDATYEKGFLFIRLPKKS